MVDMPRIYKNGVNAKYFLEDQPIVMWQPAWLRLIEAERYEEEAQQGPVNAEEEEIRK